MAKLPIAGLSEDDRITALGLSRLSFEFIEAAIVVDAKQGSPHTRRLLGHISSLPAYHLLAHAIELALKTHLRQAGVSPEVLRRKPLGHDLQTLRAKATHLGIEKILRFSRADDEVFDLLTPLQAAQTLRYPRNGVAQFPSWHHALRLAVRLHRAIAPTVGNRVRLPSYILPKKVGLRELARAFANANADAEQTANP